MATCQRCSRPASNKSGIIDGIYYARLCSACITERFRLSSGQAKWNRQRDLEDHEADIIQPYEGGLPSARFIHLYPERARELFTSEQIEDAVRR